MASTSEPIEHVVQGLFVEDDRADVGRVVLETEQAGDEGGVLVDEAAVGLRRQGADGLEVADR